MTTTPVAAVRRPEEANGLVAIMGDLLEQNLAPSSGGRLFRSLVAASLLLAVTASSSAQTLLSSASSSPVSTPSVRIETAVSQKAPLSELKLSSSGDLDQIGHIMKKAFERKGVISQSQVIAFSNKGMTWGMKR